MNYLIAAFRDQINYSSADPLQPIDPLRYRTPEGDSCLHIAARRGDLRAVQILIEAGVDVNLRGDLGDTPLHDALAGGNQDVINCLLKHGAIPDLVNELGEKAKEPE